ncbi:MAG TPA: hypothetical protein VHG28_21950 [Longimicrobiaceae bacterium]|nr:hypothetical protein [Longimicrobiaceae bacterium]
MRDRVRSGWLAVCVALAAACTAPDPAPAGDRARDAAAAAPAAADTSRADPPAVLLLATVAPEIDEESGIVSREVEAPGGRAPLVRNDTMYADAAALAAVLGAGTSVSLEGDRVRVGNRLLGVRGLRERGGVYVPVRDFAREFGAYTYTDRSREGGAVYTLYPREALLYLLANRERPDEVPVLRGAREEGLLPERP